MSNEILRVSKSSVGVEEIEAVTGVIQRAYLGMGADTMKFEDELKSFIGGERHVICVNTGTSALHLALECLDIGFGDEVLVPSFTYVATYQAITASGAKPVSCDVSRNTGFLSVLDAEQRITPATKAIMPVHYASQCIEIDEVYELAKKYNLRVIEDAAHSFGCYRNGKRIGRDGDIVCFSFDGIKNITSGEGGAIVTSDHNLAERARDARLLGVVKDTEARYKGQRSWIFDVTRNGYRYHMSNIMAAIGSAQLKKFNSFSDKRRALAEKYHSALSLRTEIELFNFDYTDITPHIFPIKVLNKHRDELKEYLLMKGIETGIHYIPNNRLTFFSDDKYRCQVSELLGEMILSLPLHPEVSLEQADQVIQEINIFFEMRV